jgi:hypothetical protein
MQNFGDLSIDSFPFTSLQIPVANQGVSPAVAVIADTATKDAAIVFTVHPSTSECWADTCRSIY